jgi:acetyl-CoA carboxylase carboxyl transferase subunit alpha
MQKQNFLDFEKDIEALHRKIENLREMVGQLPIDVTTEIKQLTEKKHKLTKSVYHHLTPWQVIKVSRHCDRPYTLDYINTLFTDFVELHGDRHFADDPSIVGGLARFDGVSCVVLGHQKGRNVKERTKRNFGMGRPEGYRKALRIMKLAEKFGLPVFTFVDTPGAYPGIGAEERNQSEAIGYNIFNMAQLETPVITTIIGEGGSGGALAIAVADRILMLQYAVYSVISPEGCASILWKTNEKAEVAAAALGITAERLKDLGLIDDIVEEPLGGAHQDPKKMTNLLRPVLADHLQQLKQLSTESLLQKRYERLQSYGQFTDTSISQSH